MKNLKSHGSRMIMGLAMISAVLVGCGNATTGAVDTRRLCGYQTVIDTKVVDGKVVEVPRYPVEIAFGFKQGEIKKDEVYFFDFSKSIMTTNADGIETPQYTLYDLYDNSEHIFLQEDYYRVILGSGKTCWNKTDFTKGEK